MSGHIVLELNGKIATITLNRPEKLNAFDEEMLGEWIDVLEECRTSDDHQEAVRAAREARTEFQCTLGGNP